MSRGQKKDLVRILISTALFVLGLLLPYDIPKLVLFLLAYLVVGYDVLKEAGEGIIHGQVFDENFLMSIATIGAVAVGEYPEAVAVMLLYQIGELFQRYAVGKSRASISSLMDIRPETADVERSGEVVTVDPEEVDIGEIFVVKPGERIPLDGVIVEGASSLNTAALTGVNQSMVEAAKIDGAGEWQVFSKVCMPQCRAALYSIAILVFIDYWNMVEQPIVLLPDAEKQPLSVYLSTINTGEVGLAFAIATIYMVPTLLLFLHGEEYLVEGIATQGSVKG